MPGTIKKMSHCCKYITINCNYDNLKTVFCKSLSILILYNKQTDLRISLMYSDTGQRCGKGGCDAGDMLAGETIHISGGRGVWDIR